MKLLSHSNGLHTVDKEKISKIRLMKRCIAVFLVLLSIGFIIQATGKFINNSRLQSKFKYVRIEGKKLEYRLKSKGEYTVIFDGSIGANLYEWNKVCETLEEQGNVSTFIYNRRGYGFNDGGEALTPEQQAEELKLLLRKAGASEPYIFVGEEYGSLVATNFAKMYPDSVAGVVLVNPIDEKKLSSEEAVSRLRGLYIKSSIENFGSTFSITSLLDKCGIAIQNENFESSLSENELDEFNSFKNKKNYREAIANEIKNLYKDVSNSQEDGLLSSKPLYIITNDENESLNRLGSEDKTTVYVNSSEAPVSITDSESIITGVNTVLKQARKLSKVS